MTGFFSIHGRNSSDSNKLYKFCQTVMDNSVTLPHLHVFGFLEQTHTDTREMC